jgi:hypothetical protein
LDGNNVRGRQSAVRLDLGRGRGWSVEDALGR